MLATTMSGRWWRSRAMASSPSATATTSIPWSAKVIAIRRWTVGLSSARSSVGTSGQFRAGARVTGDEIDDRLHRRARQKDAGDPELVEPRNIDVRNDA